MRLEFVVILQRSVATLLVASTQEEPNTLHLSSTTFAVTRLITTMGHMKILGEPMKILPV